MPNERPSTCKARQVSDQMSCHQCRLVWDTDDSDPPRCLPLPKPKTSPHRRRASDRYT